MTIHPAELIERKRDGGEFGDDEMRELVLGYARGDVPDYQMAAFCMAVVFRGLTGAATLAMTEAFIGSGETVDMAHHLGRRVVDKHSTGGVGDKTSIAVEPIIAACGDPVRQDERPRPRSHGRHARQARVDPRVSRGTDLDEFIAQVRDVGMAIIGTTADLVPADKQLYGLRDVTATVDNVSLIAASIMWAAGITEGRCGARRTRTAR